MVISDLTVLTANFDCLYYQLLIAERDFPEDTELYSSCIAAVAIAAVAIAVVAIAVITIAVVTIAVVAKAVRMVM